MYIPDTQDISIIVASLTAIYVAVRDLIAHFKKKRG